MKSIKGKAEEHLNSVYAGYDDVLKKLVKEGYASGANYVLEQLEEFLNLYGVYCITSSAKAYLKDMIEQLKK